MECLCVLDLDESNIDLIKRALHSLGLSEAEQIAMDFDVASMKGMLKLAKW
eukprot:CAMPEP_0204908122 /NCGR_PEP_ID=MMETSP1397-20131031/7127_1 /ASSEMBLY_ACC=CAM_ASM_000891 /TAXON_ID=49980 /ORGANISM="Climacostomum Climacostomum virens, Strain Stock W-24" /LENGTH=50 /DNA_ID=CAMNT_0052077511 /DNA_START=131 /DNA_END=280 /DNA_ORIENTATION=+